MKGLSYPQAAEVIDIALKSVYNTINVTLTTPDALGVALPSVLVPLSYNVILRPAHALFDQIRVVGQEDQPVDRRLWRQPD